MKTLSVYGSVHQTSIHTILIVLFLSVPEEMLWCVRLAVAGCALDAA